MLSQRGAPVRVPGSRPGLGLRAGGFSFPTLPTRHPPCGFLALRFQYLGLGLLEKSSTFLILETFPLPLQAYLGYFIFLVGLTKSSKNADQESAALGLLVEKQSRILVGFCP